MAKKTKVEMCRNRGEIEEGIIEGVKSVLEDIKKQKGGEPLYQKEYEAVRKAVDENMVASMAEIFIENFWEPKDADKLVAEATEKAIAQFKAECKAKAKGAPGQKAVASAEKGKAVAKTSAKVAAKPEPKKAILKCGSAKTITKQEQASAQKSSVQKKVKGKKEDF